MKSPWTCNDKAFDVMFGEVAQFVTKSNQRSTINCCIFPLEDVDPFVDTDTTNEVKRANVLVRKKDWMSFKETPAIGNLVITPDGRKWKIEQEDLEQDWWSIKVRSIA